MAISQDIREASSATVADVEALTRFPDEFRGDDAKLIGCIVALLSLDAAVAQFPKSIGGHAQNLLSATMHRISALHERAQKAEARVAELEANNIIFGWLR